jgi:ethanolamine transporter EutH
MGTLPELPVYAFQPNLGGLLSMILTLILPLAVAVITTRVTSSNVKGILLLIIVAIKTLVEALISNGADYIHFAWVAFLMNLVINFAFAVMMHFGLWKPTGAAAKVQEDVGLKARDWEEPVTR